jgi:hypothetical protein
MSVVEVGDISATVAIGLKRRSREAWLVRPPSARLGDPRYAFRSVAHRWVQQNPNSRENVMRSILERLFDKPFPSVRPCFLRNPATGRSLELDGFNAELRVAAEHMGVQHSKFPNPFHSNRAQFLAVQQRDKIKAQLCAQFGIKLVVLPYDVPRKDMEAFLISQLTEELKIANRVEDTTERKLLRQLGELTLM